MKPDDLKTLIIVVLCLSFVVVVAACAPARPQADKVGYFSVEMIRVEGVRCVLATSNNAFSAVAISCDWGE